MRLYQHSTRCPIALRTFLDCNPNYKCFIPYEWHEAQDDNIVYCHELARTNNTTPTDIPISIQTTVQNSVSSHTVKIYLDHVPLPPASHAFAYRQILQQRTFFEQFLSSSSLDSCPYISVDLYKVAIIAVRK